MRLNCAIRWNVNINPAMLDEEHVSFSDYTALRAPNDIYKCFHIVVFCAIEFVQIDSVQSGTARMCDLIAGAERQIELV